MAQRIGPSYNRLPMVDIGRDLRPDGWRIFEAARQLSPNIVCFLPRSTNLRQARITSFFDNMCWNIFSSFSPIFDLNYSRISILLIFYYEF
jgi:hypothetical protein